MGGLPLKDKTTEGKNVGEAVIQIAIGWRDYQVGSGLAAI